MGLRREMNFKEVWDSGKLIKQNFNGGQLYVANKAFSIKLLENFKPTTGHCWRKWFLENVKRLGTYDASISQTTLYKELKKKQLIEQTLPIARNFVEIDFSKPHFTSYQDFAFRIREAMACNAFEDIKRHQSELSEFRKYKQKAFIATSNQEAMEDLLQRLSLDYIYKRWMAKLKVAYSTYQKHTVPGEKERVLYDIFLITTYLSYSGFLREAYVKHFFRNIHNEYLVEGHTQDIIFDVYDTDDIGDCTSRIDFLLRCRKSRKCATFGVSRANVKNQTKEACRHVFVCEQSSSCEDIFVGRYLHVPTEEEMKSVVEMVFNIKLKKRNKSPSL